MNKPDSSPRNSSPISDDERILGLRMQLKSPKPDLRIQAVERLGEMGETAKVAVPDLLLLLQDVNLDVQITAIKTLSEMKSQATIIEPHLISLLKHTHPDLRGYAARSLGALADSRRNDIARKKDIVFHLSKLLDDRYLYVRVEALSALRSMGDDAQTIIPQLLPLFKSPSTSVRFAAIGTLRGIGQSDRFLTVELLPLLKDADPMVRLATLDTIGSTPKSIPYFLPHITPLLKDPVPEIRAATIEALVEMRNPNAISVRDVLPLLFDSNSSVSVRAGKMIMSLKLEDSPEFRTEIQKVNRDLEAISKLPAEKAIAEIRSRLKNSDSLIQASARIALFNLGRTAKVTPSQISTLLNAVDPSVWTRSNES
ncbi:HEAT repeat domain-containing protein [Alkalinema sp. FACHB-956]|uniref:HEAT repeat domain-containing protein n=1 Tax=Alkalinema sp. FACHB-956 TaxID=2692768 RepID=UPI00168667E2|nr:HEAT repeat domain-containing protein [Alkalinema sp. FACHB-956]MBD2329527.1 HEAT repeat domain-containing protein [Alkalinema sp. FACHB-956]